MNEIPTKGELIQLDFIRREKSLRKDCECTDARFIIDERNVKVNCAQCGARVEAFAALVKMADLDEKRNNVMQKLRAQAQEMQDYKPHLRIIKFLEKQWRKKDVVPTCPSCDEPFLLEELKTWVGRKFVEARIQKRIDKTGE